MIKFNLTPNNAARHKTLCSSLPYLAMTLLCTGTAFGNAGDATCSIGAEVTDAAPCTSVELQPDTTRLTQIKAELRKLPGYARDEGQTYLTLPEWYLVYSPAEYATYLKEKPPSGFPYFGSIAQFWGYYGDINDATRGKYPFNFGYHTMISVIGTSFTVENGIKGIYENTIGRVTEWTSSEAMTDEDRYAANAAQHYVDFIRIDPWYEYSFAKQALHLWTDTSLVGANMIRKTERKIALTTGYLLTAIYATAIKLGTKLAYGDADTEMLTLVQGATPQSIANEPKISLKRTFDESYSLLSLPRYEEFRDAVERLSRKGVRFIEIAGNDNILITCVVPATWQFNMATGAPLFERPILTNSLKKRIALRVPVPALHEVIARLQNDNIEIEHIYDY